MGSEGALCPGAWSRAPEEDNAKLIRPGDNAKLICPGDKRKTYLSRGQRKTYFVQESGATCQEDKRERLTFALRRTTRLITLEVARALERLVDGRVSYCEMQQHGRHPRYNGLSPLCYI